MPEVINLADKIEKQLPPELVSFMRQAGEVASRQEQSLYLVGGVVRDLLLEGTNLDLDLVVEGDAINLARQLAEVRSGKITTHPRFRTAKIQWDKWSVDLATARAETYTVPGALPRVQPSSLSDDLFRRDFTINAMAVHLNPGHYGELIDLFGGRDDLSRKLVRVLHDKSFVDDATRILRGLRYEQRLDLRLETTTLQLLKRDVTMLDTISGDRIRHELELILKEEFPEKVLFRTEELGVLPKLHPALKGDGWLTEKFGQARKTSYPDLPPVALYLSLWCYHLTGEEIEQLISRLRLPKALAQTLRDTNSIKANLIALSDPELPPSRVYRLLQGYSATAIITSSLATDSPVAHQYLELFLNKLRYVKAALTGDALKILGVATGPDMKEILKLLHEARLDGEIASKKDAESLVKRWLN